MANLTVKLGTSAWDAVAYVRAQIEDTTTPFTVPDASLTAYAEVAAEEFSRHVPLEDMVGNPFTNTSGFNTVANTQRYVCNAGNGFAASPTRIIGCLWRAGSAYTNTSDISYLVFSPATPVNQFLFGSDWLENPTYRVIRSEYLTELERFGRGAYGVSRDRATGLLALDLFPVPSTSLPVFVRYQCSHVNTPDGNGFPTYPTVPEELKLHFAKLFLAEVYEQEADRLAKFQKMQAGFTQYQGSAADLRQKGASLRDDVFLALEGAAGSGMAMY